MTIKILVHTTNDTRVQANLQIKLCCCLWCVTITVHFLHFQSKMSFISPSYFTFFPFLLLLLKCCDLSDVDDPLLFVSLGPERVFLWLVMTTVIVFKKYSLKSSAGLRRDNFGWHFLGDLTRLSLPTIISRGLARDAAFSKEEDPTCLQLDTGFTSLYPILPN